LPDRSEPEPDIALLRPRKDNYKARHPGPADILLIVEVMDTSALRDRGQKLTAYAKAGIPEVWLVDLADETIEVHFERTGKVYGRTVSYQRGDTLAPLAFSEARIALSDLFGPSEEGPVSESVEDRRP
jgi:Uma2 family endonuclease